MTVPAPLSVLVIDDSAEDRLLYGHLLNHSPFRSVAVREAATGEEGIRLARADAPGCILLDFRLPDLDGLEVLEALRDDDGEPVAPVIMLTGQGDEHVAVRAIQAGAQDYLVKGSLSYERLDFAIVGARARFAYRQKELAQRRELRAFAYAAAHDLKAPLRRASAFAGILSELCDGELGAQAQGAVTGITRSLHQMQIMVDSLLAFARCGSGVPSERPVALAAAVRLALTNLSGTFELQRASIQVGTLPTVPGDEIALAILFQNLIANALKYNRSERPEIVIDALREEAMWVIRVWDNGIGIGPEHLEEVFLPLRRLHSIQEFEGTGLGLATCRRVAEHHHGSIRCESEPGHGTAFLVKLPAESRKRPATAPAGVEGHPVVDAQAARRSPA